MTQFVFSDHVPLSGRRIFQSGSAAATLPALKNASIYVSHIDFSMRVLELAVQHAMVI